MDFSIRSYQPELLDGSEISFEDIKRNMQELEFINRWLGGHAITIAGLQQLLTAKDVHTKPVIHICEIGSGGGDNLKAIEKWCKKNTIAAKFTGIDVNPNCVAFAKKQFADADFICSDYRNVIFNDKPDIIFSSLFCHHFTSDELIMQLQWMLEQSAAGFFINDLHRHFLAYHSIKLLTSVFSSSYLVKNDAPLSVQRGFVKSEWDTILQAADITSKNIKWKWAFRWLITVIK